MAVSPQGKVAAPLQGFARRLDEYTEGVDKVRLGRALGYGTRHAAKTLAAVAEAAAAPGPGPTSTRQVTAASPSATSPQAAGEPPRRSRMPLRVPSAAQVRVAGSSFWGPLATFSGALWLRVTGLFFAVIALAMANGAWRLRGAIRNGATGTHDTWHFWLFAAFAVLFAYFAVSSFARATLRERRGTRARSA